MGSVEPQSSELQSRAHKSQQQAEPSKAGSGRVGFSWDCSEETVQPSLAFLFSSFPGTKMGLIFTACFM